MRHAAWASRSKVAAAVLGPWERRFGFEGGLKWKGKMESGKWKGAGSGWRVAYRAACRRRRCSWCRPWRGRDGRGVDCILATDDGGRRVHARPRRLACQRRAAAVGGRAEGIEHLHERAVSSRRSGSAHHQRGRDVPPRDSEPPTPGEQPFGHAWRASQPSAHASAAGMRTATCCDVGRPVDVPGIPYGSAEESEEAASVSSMGVLLRCRCSTGGPPSPVARIDIGGAASAPYAWPCDDRSSTSAPCAQGSVLVKRQTTSERVPRTNACDPAQAAQPGGSQRIFTRGGRRRACAARAAWAVEANDCDSGSGLSGGYDGGACSSSACSSRAAAAMAANAATVAVAVAVAVAEGQWRRRRR